MYQPVGCLPLHVPYNGCSVWQVYAYLDPGSGSVLLQALLGGVAGTIVAAKLYGHRILVRLGLRREEVDHKEDAPDEQNNDTSQ